MSLFNSLTSGVSAMQSFSRGLDVIGNNIANVNTTGFKSSSVSYADSFSNLLRSAAPSDADNSNTPAMQIGTGVNVSGIKSDFTQGAMAGTGVPTDLAIAGSGFFSLEDPVSGSRYATRAGNFRFDDSGYLVSQTGMRVMGLTGGSENGPPTMEGPLQIGTHGTPVSYSFSKSGQLVEFYEDGSSITTGRLQLLDFQDPLALTKEGSGLFSGFDVAGALGESDPGTNGRGSIESESLELSNVDLTKEFADMITVQRSFQASSRLVTVSDGVLEEIINLKR